MVPEMRVLLVLATATVLHASLAPAGAAETPPTQAWVQRYNGDGTGSSVANAMGRDAAGNIIVTGYTGAYPNNDVATVKYSPSGRLLHSARYNGPFGGSDASWALAIDSHGNVCIAGETDVAQYNNDYLTVKYDSTLTQQWARTYAGQLNLATDQATAITIDHDDNIYVTGVSYELSTANDYATIKYNPSGVQQWVRRYNDPVNGNDSAYGIVTDTAGSVYVTGQSDGSGDQDIDCATVKYDTNGTPQWVRRYDGPAHSFDSGLAIALDASGIVVAGYQTGLGTNSDFLTVKYSEAGDELWVRIHDGAAHGNDSDQGITMDRDSNIYLVGVQSTPQGDADYETIKYDAAGNEMWASSYDGAHGNDNGKVIAVDANESVYVMGISPVNNSDEYATVKYDPTGVEQWAVRYDETGSLYTSGAGIALDEQGHVFVSGTSRALQGLSYEFTTIRYDQGSTADVPAGSAPLGVRLLGPAPNPFVAATSIRFELPSEMPVELSLFDSGGRNLWSMRWGHLSPGVHSESLPLSGLHSGTYFYTLKAGSMARFGKLTRQE